MKDTKGFTTKLLGALASALGFYLAKMPHFLFVCHIKGLSAIFRAFDNRRYKDVRANLDFVYGNSMDEAEKRRIIKLCYEHFAFVILETIRVPFIAFEAHRARFSFIDERYILDALAKDSGAVLVSAHFGYWEAMASVLPPRYSSFNMASLGRLTPFSAINDMIIARRELYSVKFIDKKGAFKHLLKLYSAGNALAGILIDQNISAAEGEWIEFFGKKATHTTIASIISRRFSVAIVPVMIGIGENYRHFEVRFYPPIYTPKSANSNADIKIATQAQANAIEAAIRAKPEDWFWFHKRFKSAHEDIYANPTNH